MRSPTCAARYDEGCARRTPSRFSNGMLPGLIVLAPSTSFSFNRDHYPRSEHPPTCRLRARQSRKCTDAIRFSSVLHEPLTHTGGYSSPISVTRASPVSVRIRHGTFVCWERTNRRGDRLTNVPVCMHVSLCSVYRYKLIASAEGLDADFA